jgi:hypothetical protein
VTADDGTFKIESIDISWNELATTDTTGKDVYFKARQKALRVQNNVFSFTNPEREGMQNNKSVLQYTIDPDNKSSDGGRYYKEDFWKLTLDDIKKLNLKSSNYRYMPIAVSVVPLAPPQEEMLLDIEDMEY